MAYFFRKVSEGSSGFHLSSRSNSSWSMMLLFAVLFSLTFSQMLFDFGHDDRISVKSVRIWFLFILLLLLRISLKTRVHPLCSFEGFICFCDCYLL